MQVIILFITPGIVINPNLHHFYLTKYLTWFLHNKIVMKGLMSEKSLIRIGQEFFLDYKF